MKNVKNPPGGANLTVANHPASRQLLTGSNSRYVGYPVTQMLVTGKER